MESSSSIFFGHCCLISFPKYSGAAALYLFQNAPNAKAGSEILINGASGGVGMLLLQMAKNKGMKTQAPKKKETGHYHCDTLGEYCKESHYKYN